MREEAGLKAVNIYALTGDHHRTFWSPAGRFAFLEPSYPVEDVQVFAERDGFTWAMIWGIVPTA